MISNWVAMKWNLSVILFVVLSFWAETMAPAFAERSNRGKPAYYTGDYARTVRDLVPAARRGNARAQGQLGFMYENGFGVPQNYSVAADLYHSAAEQGDSFAQSRLGLIYDKGHGVPKDVILSYKWLDLAAARASSRERDSYRRLRDAVASKMTLAQIIEGQRLALSWAPGEL
jgi:TPR repeat protein